MNPEPIYAALFAKVKDAPGIVYATRRVKLWSDVPEAHQPALIQEQAGIGVQHQGPGFPPKWTLAADLALYVNAGNDQEAVPVITLNNLISAVCAALAPAGDQERQTLNGLVFDCRVNGKIEISEGGSLGPQAVAVIPVEIVTA